MKHCTCSLLEADLYGCHACKGNAGPALHLVLHRGDIACKHKLFIKVFFFNFLVVSVNQFKSENHFIFPPTIIYRAVGIRNRAPVDGPELVKVPLRGLINTLFLGGLEQAPTILCGHLDTGLLCQELFFGQIRELVDSVEPANFTLLVLIVHLLDDRLIMPQGLLPRLLLLRVINRTFSKELLKRKYP